MGRQVFALAGAFVIVFACVWMGLSERLGAHPFWAVKIGWLGGAAGAGLALVLILVRVPPRWRLALGAVGTVAALAAAKIGAARFAASYAEDALAGRFWFIGWICVAAALVVMLQALLGWRR
ncbi:hypothetical protein OEZ71_02290 [Defluviimonas sp. WL0050]|uniref:Uncharacterized protein n=1 Tax=Albidovulum litorale TaxID=2984134 RepID=A0ABT2ZJ26_9RHOB|nr:hypothetical protein [Defluviimonas sp. WL0050]MCV2871119.1 hypothetical protein [Defluviimonas sp. WL0050]